jgi:type IV pilus assembly protein PilW
MHTAPPVFELARRGRQCGITLVELLVALAIGLVVVLAATAAFLTSKQLFTAGSQTQAAQDSLRFAGYVVKSIVRQAGYSDYAPDNVNLDGVAVIGSNVNLLAGSYDPYDLNVVGASNTKASASDEKFSTSVKGVNGSDSLLIRFFGRTKADSVTGTGPDGTMIDCMGLAQAGPAGNPTPSDRAWSFFYVSTSSDGEPELNCKYRSATTGGFQSESLARGIEVFKVVYGYDSDGDGVPNLWLDAARLAAKATVPGKTNDEWRKVVGLRIGMVVRSARAGGGPRQQDRAADYRLYPLGAEFSSVFFDPPDDGRFRRTSTFTVMLRNVVKDPA